MEANKRQTFGVDFPSSTSLGNERRALGLTVGSVVIPCLILGSINAWNLWNEHWEHCEHLPPLEERVEYPYQNLRTKNFFWGDGDKVSKHYGSSEASIC